MHTKKQEQAVGWGCFLLNHALGYKHLQRAGDQKYHLVQPKHNVNSLWQMIFLVRHNIRMIEQKLAGSRIWLNFDVCYWSPPHLRLDSKTLAQRKILGKTRCTEFACNTPAWNMFATRLIAVKHQHMENGALRYFGLQWKIIETAQACRRRQ